MAAISDRKRVLFDLIWPLMEPRCGVSKAQRDHTYARYREIFENIVGNKDLQNSWLVAKLREEEQQVDDVIAKNVGLYTRMPNTKYFMIWRSFIHSQKKYSNDLTQLHALLARFNLARVKLIAEELGDGNIPQADKDHATMVLWSKLKLQNKPDLKTAEAIRLWMSDPANAEELKTMFSYASQWVLDLSKSNLKCWPEELNYIPDYRTLDGIYHELNRIELSHNQLKKFPLKNKIRSLKAIDLSHNQITRFPKMVVGFSGVSTLNLSNNQIEKLPEETTGLEGLWTLRIDGNKLREFPFTRGFPILREISLHGNQIRVLPTSFEAFPILTHVHISNNNIQEIPSSVIGPKLQIIFANDNPFIFIPLYYGINRDLFFNRNNFIARNYFTHPRTASIMYVGDYDMGIYNNELHYSPKTPLGQLFGSILRKSSRKEQHRLFDALSFCDKYMIRREFSDQLKDSLDPNDAFARTVRKVILTKYKQLSSAERGRVIAKLKKLRDLVYDPPNSDHLLCLQRLADAMHEDKKGQ